MTLDQWFDGLELPGLTRPLDPLSQRVGLAVYRDLACGAPVAVEDIAKRLDADASRVRDALTDRPGVVLDAQGRVTAYLGLTLKPMPIAIEVAGVRTFTWCAWDTMLVADAIQRALAVQAACAVTGAPLSIRLTPDGPLDAGSVCMSMVTPAIEALAVDFHAAFCARVHFLADRAAGASWVGSNPDGQVVSPQEAWRLAVRRNSVVLGSRSSR